MIIHRTKPAALLAAAIFGLFVLVPSSRLAAGLINIAWSTVGDPGNSPDPTTGLGEVDYLYNIGTYDVTLGQYTAFLNAVAATDQYGVYNSFMDNPQALTFGIVQSGTSGSYTYTTFGNPNVPITNVSWADAARFANWLQNGQPTGPEGPGTTETGAYAINGAMTSAALATVSRNPNATIFLPSENEWYKAAYYDPANGTYWLYSTQSNTVPSNVLSATGTNNANFFDGVVTYSDPVNYLTAVGAFADSPGPFGTYDMGGDVDQWNENNQGGYRQSRGGSWDEFSDALVSSNFNNADPLFFLGGEVGFRVASLPVPEPGAMTLLLVGAGGLLATLRSRRRTAIAS